VLNNHHIHTRKKKIENAKFKVTAQYFSRLNSTSFFTAGADYRYFDIDRTSGHVTIKRSIPEDELIQPATLVVRVRKTSLSTEDDTRGSRSSALSSRVIGESVPDC
jgi:hypothetical protein